MDCDDVDVVTYGTPLATEDDEDEAPRKKPVPIDQQEVRDERGLRRFHGAFTGGFSAGYFNTVGTKEGWTPSTFLSSRAERAGKQLQRPEDFMDTEDLGVFGIAPRAIQVNKEFAEEEKDGVKTGVRKRQFAFNEGPIPGLPPLKDLIVPSSESAGVKLLRRMGWKPGQGIGPRVKSKKKRNIKPANDATSTEPEIPGVKVYGCTIPKDVLIEENSLDEELLRGITFAPDDVEIMSYKTKDDFHGIGYTGLDRNPILATFRSGSNAIAPPPVRDKTKRLAITGEAFGVGVYEEDDENIYSLDDMSQYDFALGASTSSKNADDEKATKGNRNKAIGRVTEILEGFHLASKSSSSALRKRYPPPQLPKNFQAFHRKATDVLTISSTKHETTILDRHRMCATERAEIVETEKQKGSVFDLLRPEDKERLMSITKKNPDDATSGTLSMTSSEGISAPTKRTTLSSLFNTSSRDQKGLKGAFQPFANDENKQKRYDLYLKFKDENKEDAIFEKFQPSAMTEWEKQREMEEFRLASAIYKPLAHGMALRFVTAKQPDVDVELKNSAVPMAGSEIISDEGNLAVTATNLDYGKMTRTKLEWHPDRLLCRRFNIPNPYPESTLVGVPKVKRERFSVFNMFTGPDRKTSVGDDLLAIGAPKVPEESVVSISKVLESAASTNPNRTNLFSNLDDIETRPSTFSSDKQISSPRKDIIDAKDVDKTSDNKDDTLRPPLDLFKAIFQNTDSEDEDDAPTSDDEKDQMKKAEEADTREPIVTPIPKTISVADAIMNHSATLRAYAPSSRVSTTGGLFSNLDFDSLDKTPAADGVSVSVAGQQKRLASIAVRSPTIQSDTLKSASASYNYGPALPPNLMNQSKATDSVKKHAKSSRHMSYKEKDKKSAHKSKHKRKKTKSKHHKHRHQDEISPSEESSDLEHSQVDLNKLIKTRLKRL